MPLLSHSPFRLGDIVCIAPGASELMVVDTDGQRITVAWRANTGVAIESQLHAGDLHLVFRPD